MYNMTLILSCLFQIVIFLNITLIGGILPLVERKYLSLIQRRVGPKFVGSKGRLQFIADAIKMFLKGNLIPRDVNIFLFLLGPILFLGLIYLLYILVFFEKNLISIDLEYNLILIPIVNLLISLVSFFVGFYSKNKYATISALRIILVVVCGELVITSFYILLIYWNSNLSTSRFFYVQEEYLMVVGFSNITTLIILILLIEVAKSPFDLVEAETELVTGFHTEYGSFFFALFYLGEYLHIFFSSCTIVLVLTGLL